MKRRAVNVVATLAAIIGAAILAAAAGLWLLGVIG